MRNLFRRICAWIVTTVLLIIACLLPYLSRSALAITGENIVSYMSKAAQVQVVTQVMKTCVAKEIEHPGTRGFFSQGASVSDKWFAGVGNRNIATGAWLEGMVQGKVDNGEIWCDNNNSNIVNVFTRSLGISLQDLICDGDSPGLFYPFPESQFHEQANPPVYEGVCKSVINDSDFRFNWNKEGAVNYLKKLYDNYKATYSDTVGYFLPSFEDVYNFTEKNIAYYIYWNDFTMTCNSGASYKLAGDPMDEASYWKVGYVQDDGTVEMRYYSKRDTGSPYHKTSWSSSIVGRSGAHSCDAIAEKLSSPDYYEAAQSTIKDIIAAAVEVAENEAKERAKALCKSKALNAIVEVDSEGKIIHASGFAEAPSAAFYYLQAKQIVENPDQARQDIVDQLRESLKSAHPELDDAQIDALIAEQDSEIDAVWEALKERAQTIYDTFAKVLHAAGSTTGDGNKETSYWYEDSNGAIMCTNFQNFDGTISSDSGYQNILENLIEKATESTGNAPGLTPGGPTSDPIQNVADCYSGGGPLGWIMCPVIAAVGGITETVYDHWIEPALEIQAGKIFDRGEGVYGGWSAFRNFANIIFAILFLIVILSQVTGFGLDNYGIKKILPRLIMVAILVNVSYILCQLAVDVSNLLGVGLKDLFNNNLPVTLNGEGGLFTDGTASSLAGGIFGSLLSYLGLGVGISFIATISLPVLGEGAVWIIAMLLISFIGCVVSVIFFVITLAVRQAGVIMLVVISPIAIICYALPNTKGFFDKWKKMFQALLVVYPICGILMGGGNYAGSILLGLGRNSSIGAFYTITAMLVTVVPFFFIPTILKSSMLAMGNLGMRISNAGKRLGSGIGGLVKGSQGYQELLKERRIAFNQARINALDKLPHLSRGKSLRRNRYMLENDKLMLERAAAEANAQRSPMTYGSDLYAANVDKIRNKNVSEAAAAQEAAWENSGVSSDYGALEQIAYDSAIALRDNFNDDSARAKFLAAQKILESSDPGREHLKSALNHFEQDSAGKEIAANRAARWLANAGMDRNGKMLKHDSPTLAAQYGRYLSPTGGIMAPGNIRRDAKGNYINDQDLMARVGDFNYDQLGDFDDNDLARLSEGIRNGTITGADADKLIGLAQKAFSNPNTAAKIKGKAEDFMHEISSVGFSSEYWGSKAGSAHDYISAGASMAKASGSDIAYLETRLNDTGVSNSEKEDILKVMRSAVIGAVNDNDYLGMSAENAQRIDKIIKKYGSSYGVALNGFTGAQQKAYDRLLSNELRIKHGNTP